MKTYAGMTQDELARELNELRASVPMVADSNEVQPVPTADEVQSMVDELQTKQSSNLLIYSTLNAMQRLLHELQTHQIESEMQNLELREARQQLEESRNRYFDLYNSAPYGYLTFDGQGCIQEINRTGVEMLEQRRPSLIGKPFVACLAQGEASRFLDHLQQCQQEKKQVTTEVTLKGARAKPVQLVSILVRDEAGQKDFIRTALIDISERKQAETAANLYRAQLESVFNAIQDGLVVTDMEGNFLLVNEAQARMNGFPSAEAMKQNLAFYRDLYELRSTDGEPLPFEEWPINRVLKGESFKDQELRARRRDTGQEWFLSYSGEPVRDAQGKQMLAVVGVRDITERKHTEAALRESQARAAGIIESAMDAIVTVDAGQRIVVFNTAAEQMFQCPAAEAIGQPLDRFIPARFRHTHHQHIGNFGQTNVSKRTMGALGAIYGLRADGEEFPIEASISQIEAQGQKLFTVILRDITQRKRNEERLLEQAALLNEAQDAIISRDQEGCVTFWNRGAERIYGWTSDEMIGRNIEGNLFGENIEQLDERKRALRTRDAWQGELRQFTKAGKEVTVESRQSVLRDAEGQLRGLLVINTDISEKKRIEAQFLRAQRLESLGTLAGGIAHDLNNILSPVLMGTQMMQMKLTNAGDQRWLDIIRNNVERGAEMVKQILLFAKGVQGERVPLQLKHLIKEIVKILGETFPKSVAIKFSIPEDLALVTGDATQLHQVLMNLCVNARDAMLDGGRLVIEAANVTIDSQYAAFSPDASPGQYVQIAISDTGIGIPEEIKDKIFDPFFTTKELGKGTGLGLSTVLGIIKSHNGFIQVYSEAGKGTKFTIYLPVCTTEQTTPTSIYQRVIGAGRGELILVVDDEAAICEITRSTLEAFGYRVLTASDGTEALSLYAQHSDEIQAVLTDMMMPYLDGPATIRALQSINPAVKVIASSGLAEQEKINEVSGLGVKHFLAKPYSADRLLKTLTQVLND